MLLQKCGKLLQECAKLQIYRRAKQFRCAFRVCNNSFPGRGEHGSGAARERREEKSLLLSPRESCPGEPHVGCCVEGASNTIEAENPENLLQFDESSSSSPLLFTDITNDPSLFPFSTGGTVLGMGSSSSPSFFSAALTLPNDDGASTELLFGADEGFSVPDYTAFLQDGLWEGGQEEFALGDGLGGGFGNDGLFSDQLVAMGDGEMLFQG